MKRILKGKSSVNIANIILMKNQHFIISWWGNPKRIGINFVQWNCSDREIKTDTKVNDYFKTLSRGLISNPRWIKLILDRKCNFKSTRTMYVCYQIWFSAYALNLLPEIWKEEYWEYSFFFFNLFTYLLWTDVPCLM